MAFKPKTNPVEHISINVCRPQIVDGSADSYSSILF